MKDEHFSPFVTLVIKYMPQCVSFDVRATLFKRQLKNDADQQRQMPRSVVKIRRALIFEDGFDRLKYVQNLRHPIHVVFVNNQGIVEEGQDAGGIFKEFLTQLIKIVFNPNYGLFVLTP